MTKQQKQELAEFSRIMGQEAPLATAQDLTRLVTLSRRHAKLQERACNEPVPEGHDATCEAMITALCARIGVKPTFSGDPRGCTVKLVVPSGRTNDFGQEGICVPQ